MLCGGSLKSHLGPSAVTSAVTFPIQRVISAAAGAPTAALSPPESSAIVFLNWKPPGKHEMQNPPQTAGTSSVHGSAPAATMQHSWALTLQHVRGFWSAQEQQPAPHWHFSP